MKTKNKGMNRNVHPFFCYILININISKIPPKGGTFDMNIKKEKKYNYLYKITNKINNKIYIGVHSTDDLDDGYMGSGVILKLAKEKYGEENFVKEILEFFDTSKEMLDAEANVVNPEFRKRKDTYNIAIGGNGGDTGMYDDQNRSKKISDKMKNRATMIDKDGNIIKVSCDIDYDSKELVGITKKHCVYKNVITNETVYTTTDDPRIKTGELKGVTVGMISVKDKYGNTFSVRKDDERYLSGELVGVTKGSKQTEESNRKRSLALKGVKKEQPKFKCPVCGFTTTKTNLIRWHKNCQMKFCDINEYIKKLIKQ